MSRATISGALRPTAVSHSATATHGLDSGIEAELFKLGWLLDPIKIDVPHRRIDIIVGLDDGEARARHFAPMTERRKKAPRKCRLADAKRPGKCNHIPCPRLLGEF